ncbi:MAG: hypothetical protein J0M25_00650 [Flavobacteriales bacterium]|nr:hypothetical protein [Flavobacteriales bacterium]
MKAFIQKNKWLISTILIILMQVQEIVEISPAVKTIIQILIISLTVITQRVELLEMERNVSASLSGRGKEFFINVTIFQAILENLKAIPTDFQPKNISWKENIPSHILLGGGVLFVISGFLLIGWEPWMLYTVGGFLAYCLGFSVEYVQVTFFDGTTNNRDIRWTTYGYYLFIPLFILLNKISTDYVANLITGVLLWVLAFVLHRLNRK